MDPRKLKRLLDTFRDAGVAEVELSDKLQPTRIKFGAALMPVSDEDVEVEKGAEWTAGAPMALAEAYQRIQKAYQPKPAKAS